MFIKCGAQEPTESHVDVNDPRSPSKGKFQSVFSVSTFKAPSWGPIALKGPRGGGLAADALDAEPIMRYGG